MTALAAYGMQKNGSRSASCNSASDHMQHPSSLEELLALAGALCKNAGISCFTPEEKRLVDNAPAPADVTLEYFRKVVASGADILGQEYCRIKTPELRRSHGAVFTPDSIIESMLRWAEDNIAPKLVVDPGAGSARYALAAALRFPNAKVIAVEIDPVLRILAKTRISLLGLEDRVTVHPGSFLDFEAPNVDGAVLYIGNPPYVRHHDISKSEKKAFTERCKRLGLHCSSLAGLHIHFMAKVFEMARPGDAMSFITSAEWLDTNYARGVRDFLSSGKNDTVIGEFCRKDTVFEDAMASAVVTSAIFGKPSATILFNKLSSDDLANTPSGLKVAADVAQHETSWSGLHVAGAVRKPGGKTLGDFFKISRGMVTGMNKVWITGKETPLLPDYCYRPCISSAGDITGAESRTIDSTNELERIIVLPESFEDLPKPDRKQIETFLKWAKKKEADKTFTAKQRKHWWVLNCKEPAPIIMTYMGRRPPVFVRNTANVTFLNVAHGLYPKQSMTDEELNIWVSWLNQNVSTGNGRGYAGGLVKFEPGEAMRIPVEDMEFQQSEQM